MTVPPLYRAILDELTDGVYLVGPDRRIRFWNRAAERISGFTAEEMLGRSCAEDLLVHVDDRGHGLCDGACPLACALQDSTPQTSRLYLRHREGHRVPVEIRVAPLRDGDGTVIGAVETFRDVSESLSAAERLHELERLAYLDPLTELPNRRHVESALAMRLQELDRYGWPFGVVFADIDRFKAVNDVYGHDVGDRVLRMVARTMARSARPFDVVGRWGGEEFVAVVANVDRPQLVALADRFRSLVAESRLAIGDQKLGVTLSVGASVARDGDDGAGLVARADRLMYEAKGAGGDRVHADGAGVVSGFTPR